MIKRLLVISVLLFATTVHAQELKKNGIFSWNDFGGGLDTKISNLTLPKNKGDIVENIRFDNEQKSLTKRDKTVPYGTADADNPIIGMHRLYLSSGTKVLLVNYSNKVAKGSDSAGTFTDILTLGTGDRRAQWQTWHDLAIGTDGYNQPYKYDGSSDSATYLGSALATDAGSGAGPDGIYSYKIACYTASYELSLGAASNTITVVNNDIDLTMIPICPDTYLGEDVTGRNVYRTGDDDSTYVLLSNGVIANNTAVTLTDSDADGARSGAYSPTATATPPKGKLIVLHKNRLWIVNNPDNPSRAYYSDDASHDYFPAINYLDIRKNDGDEITFAKNLLGKLTIGKNNTIQKIYTDGGTPADDWAISDPFSFIGCHSMYSAVNTPIGIIYLSNNGLYVFNGQHSSLLSEQVTPEIRDITPSNFVNVWGEYYKNAYYMAYTSIKTGATSNDRVLILDLVNKAYSIDLVDVNVFHVLRSGSDVEALYSGGSSEGKVFAHNETVNEVVHKIQDDFSGTFWEMRYTPTAIGGDALYPVIGLSRTATIDSVTGGSVSTIDAYPGLIDRASYGGYYTSQVLELAASTDFSSIVLDKAYWNETVPAAGGNVTLKFRAGSSSSNCEAAGWSSTVSDPSGSDISNATADTFVQYYVSMDTTNLAYTPTLYRANNYVIRFTYNTRGTTAETTIPFVYRSGWTDLGFPGYKKTIRKIYAYHTSAETGTYDIELETYAGDTDEFEIDLSEYPDQYTDYITSGALTGELFRLNVRESSLNPFAFRNLIVMFDLEPMK